MSARKAQSSDFWSDEPATTSDFFSGTGFTLELQKQEPKQFANFPFPAGVMKIKPETSTIFTVVNKFLKNQEGVVFFVNTQPYPYLLYFTREYLNEKKCEICAHEKWPSKIPERLTAVTFTHKHSFKNKKKIKVINETIKGIIDDIDRREESESSTLGVSMCTGDLNLDFDHEDDVPTYGSERYFSMKKRKTNTQPKSFKK
jgi:hypothetical protein